MTDVSARLFECMQDTAECGSHRKLQPVQHEIVRNRQTQTAQVGGSGWRRFLSGEHCVENGATTDRGAQRPDRVQTERQRHDAGQRNPTGCRLVSHDTAERRRNAARPAGIRAQGDGNDAVRHRDATARRTSARDTPSGTVPWAARRSVMRVDAEAGERELRHIRPPDGDEACLEQSFHHRRMLTSRWSIGQHA